ncbi:MAG: rubredoxin [Methanoregulaceae archaeon]|nr:rubredoxin [Methanoregulaceae archaeon]
MTRYRCNVCMKFEYSSSDGYAPAGIVPGMEPSDLPGEWKCPVCGADRSHLRPVPEKTGSPGYGAVPLFPEPGSDYLTGSSQNHLPEDQILPEQAIPLESHYEDIHTIAVTGKSIIDPMRTRKRVISWDDILIVGAQLGKIPRDPDDEIGTRTIIGPRAKIPLVIETPIYVTHMSFGALSREAMIAISRGCAAVHTATCSGEGGILDEARSCAYRFIFEYVPNRYSVSEATLRSADAVEIKIGQSAEPGLGARLPAEKVTPEIASVRGYPSGVDIVSPAGFPDIRNRDDLLEKIRWLREKSGGKPVGVKIAAGDIEGDLDVIIHAGADFVTIDGRPGATGAALKFVKDTTSIPAVHALSRARAYLDERAADGISLVATGGLRISPDFAKALAIGADAVAIGTSALIACGCRQYRLCNTGRCPVGLTTQDPELRKRFNIEESAKRLENFLRVSTDELKQFARLTGNTSVHAMGLRDLRTVNSEISDYTAIRHV